MHQIFYNIVWRHVYSAVESSTTTLLQISGAPEGEKIMKIS